MRMWLSGQEFCRAFAYTFRPFASHEDTVVQEEAQQIQITLPEISTQEEVVAQAAIEVFEQRTAPVGFSHCMDKNPPDRMELPRQLLIQLVTAHPVGL